MAETRCLGICPKGAVTLVDTRAPGRWRLIRRRVDVTELAATLCAATPQT